MIEIDHFTDPACPFAFSAEPVRQRLRWHYGDRLRWNTRMIVLTREPGEAEKLAEGAPNLQRRYGMPIHPEPYPRPASSEPACRAFVAVRLHCADRADAFLRRLRVRVMLGGLLDDPALIDAAALDAGVKPADLAAWVASEQAALALEADAAAARNPLPAARALDHKLGGPAEQRRYTAPSYVIGGHVVPGFHPVEVYEAAIANHSPDLVRRPIPDSIEQVLVRAAEPLATAEVALIMQTSIDKARRALEASAVEHRGGADAYWTRSSAAA